MMTVTFEDCGQDFLEWDIDGGVVVDCRPFQAFIWVGKRVFNHDIQPGDFICIRESSLECVILKYPVKSVARMVH